MALGKKIRFEVFKRDNFTCGYCGNTPPKVVLEVDHIKPIAKKGTDDINNLITSCFDCNRGKRDVELTSITPQLKATLEALKEREEQLAEYYKYAKKIEKRTQNDIEEIDRYFHSLYNPDKVFTDSFRQATLKTFLKSLDKYEIMWAIDKAKSKQPDETEKAISYFCGICWNLIRKTSYGEK